MPPHLVHLTPEALLGRNDSKNPATTCRGITGSGRPCRRALASPRSSPSNRRGSSISALNGEKDDQMQEAFYCWQHKDQVPRAVREPQDDTPTLRPLWERRSTEILSMQERNSIDTFVQRLGLENTVEQRKEKRLGNGNAGHDLSKPGRRIEANGSTKPRNSTARAPHGEKYGLGSPERRAASRSQPKPRGFWASLCCMSSNDDDYIEIVRHRKRVEQASNKPPIADFARPVPSSSNTRTTTAAPRAPIVSGTTSTLPIRPSPQPRTSSNSQTGHLLSLIPVHLSPQTTSLLLTELIKPLSPNDEEGYIYIFWLTPQTRAAPPEAAARSLLSVPGASTTTRPQQMRRVSDVMTEYSFAGSEPDTRDKRTIMLKIGRANNVTRRMNEWQRQCGYALTLVRWYPYVPSGGSSPSPSPAPSPRGGVRRAEAGAVEYPDLSLPPPPRRAGGERRESTGVRKVACVKRVERLIHLELAERRVKRQCEACGREHREWFEVEATRAGVRAVDECVRRWVTWAEERAGG